MKKIFAIVLTLAMVLSLAAVPALAEVSKLDGTNKSASQDVKATYNAGDSTKTVYSVAITWGEMDFAYNDGAWNPDTHKFGASWAVTGNTVTVTNHSNVAVDAKLTYTAEKNYADITGTFSKDVLNLDSAVGTDVNNAPSDIVTLDLSGVLSSSTPAGTAIGTVTVTPCLIIV